MERKTFVVLGLGIFGSSLAKDLTKYGHDVIALDREISNIERIKDDVTNAICLDFTDFEQLKQTGIDGFDYGIITTGSQLEESILGILNLKELGVKQIIAKAKNRRYSDVLKKVGADITITPEKDVAKSFAKKLSSDNILELFDLGNHYTIFEIKVPDAWVNKSLLNLNLRSNYNINVIGIKVNDELKMVVDPNQPLLKEYELLVIGNDETFQKISKI